jgi:enoyl-[acyl-carrier protein] reductase II
MVITSIAKLFNIKLPIIQGGMAHVSRAELAAAVSEAGGLGLLGSSAMTAPELKDEIARTRGLTSKPFGVNIAIMSPEAEAKVEACIAEKVGIVFTAAGNPKLYTQRLRSAGIKVAHVVPSARLAEKAVSAGVDAVVCEGFEAGGHDGIEELTTMTLVPMVRRVVGDRPLIAAGGIVTGAQMAAAFALGADGVQIGTLFIATQECNAHPLFKQKVAEAGETGTAFIARRYRPQRVLKNPFAERIMKLDASGATGEAIRDAYGPDRGRRGAIDGDWEEGYFNCGQGACLIGEVRGVKEVMERLAAEYNNVVIPPFEKGG